MTLPAALSRLIVPQTVALAAILAINWLLFPGFFHISVQDGRLFGSLIDVLNRAAPVAILAIGMAVVIATRGVDLSVGAIMAVAGAVAATLVVAGWPMPVALAVTLAAGVACGLWNGFLVAVLDMQPIIATLVLMVAGRGLAQLISAGEIVTFADPWLTYLGTGAFLGLPVPALIMLGLMAATTAVLGRTALGLFIAAVGVNRPAARIAGIRCRTVLFLVYGFSGFCAAIAGVLVAADISGADANNAGLWLELDAILAVVIGGAALSGGRFSVPLAVLGAVIIQAMNTGILMSGFPPEFNLIIKAGVIIAILVLQSPKARALFGAGKAAS